MTARAPRSAYGNRSIRAEGAIVQAQRVIRPGRFAGRTELFRADGYASRHEHSLVLDSGWREAADTSLRWLKKHAL
jgi:hypothetical protein